MGQYLMIKNVEKNLVVFNFSRNNELYLALSETIDFPYNKWEPVNGDQLQFAYEKVLNEKLETEKELLYLIASGKEYIEIKQEFENLFDYSFILGQIQTLINVCYWEKYEWCFV